MPVIRRYNHTARKLLAGEFLAADAYIINLYSSLTFNPAHTTKAQVEAAATQLATANGYTQDTKALASVTVSTVTVDDAAFDAADVSWTASGGAIGGATYAVIFDTEGVSLADAPPLVAVDFEGTITAADGDPFSIGWPSSGIIVVRDPL